MQSMWSDGVLSDRDYAAQFGYGEESEEEPDDAVVAGSAGDIRGSECGQVAGTEEHPPF